MTPLLSEIGLPLDLIGAAMLALGLFRPTKPHYPGWQRSPWEASQDQAFGVVGFLFLACGFTLQALSNLGVGKVPETPTADIAPVITLGAGACLAYVLYGLVYIWRFPREYRRVRDEGPPVYRQRRGLRFCAFVEESWPGPSPAGRAQTPKSAIFHSPPIRNRWKVVDRLPFAPGELMLASTTA